MKLPKSRNVFILCTGRNGSVSFAKACSHFTNYTSGHETRVKLLGDERVNYPNGHIEADNRLSWFLGRLDQKFGDDAVYVHLRRDVDAVAESYNKRWHLRSGIVSAYATGIAYQSDLGLAAARDMVRTIEENIASFLKDKSRKITIEIASIAKQFPSFAKLIEAEGDLAAAQAEFEQRHNSSANEQREHYSGLEENATQVHYAMARMVDDYRKQLKEYKADQLRMVKLLGEVEKLESKLSSAGLKQKQLTEKLAATESQLREIKGSSALYIGNRAETKLDNVFKKPFLYIGLGLTPGALTKIRKSKTKSGSNV